MELNKTKAITAVPRPGLYSLYNYFTNAHPLISNISAMTHIAQFFYCAIFSL